MQFTNPTTGPFVVSGGTVTTVTGDVQGNVGGHVAGDVQGNVGGHVTGDVQGNVVGSVASVAGNVAGNVAGSVASVTGNVTPDPASSIATVSQSVPTFGRDTFFWQAVSSAEPFAPTLSNGGYVGYQNFPAYRANGAGVALVATFPALPRVSPSNKQNLAISFQFADAASAAALTAAFVWGNAAAVSAGTPGVMMGFDTTNHAVFTIADAGATEVFTSAAVVRDSNWHSAEIDISAAGVVTCKVDGVVVGTSAARLPPTVIIPTLTPIFKTPALQTSFRTQLSYVWS